MAEFVTTTGISNSLESIITETKERLVIVTPYLKVNPLLKDLLEEKDRWKIDIRVIYGKSELNPQESSWLESLTSVRTSFCENLHAKCYMNEATVLITSMNLYEFSQVNNREMGILVSREGDPDLYQKIYDEVGRLLRISEEIRITIARVEGEEEQATPAQRRSTQTPAPRRTVAAASQPARRGGKDQRSERQGQLHPLQGNAGPGHDPRLLHQMLRPVATEIRPLRPREILPYVRR